MFALQATTRISFRVFGMLIRRAREPKSVPVLIFGAGDAGELVLRECLNNEKLGFRVSGFIDDDVGKIGRIIHGFPVLGGLKSLDSVIKEHEIRGVIIATGIPLDSEKVESILAISKSNEAWVRRFSLDLELL